jgi:PAS domain S-box-containing protein
MAKMRPTGITPRLILSFSVLIIILLLFGLVTLHDLHSISGLTQTIYDHPLAVSNAALQSSVSITKMHRNMKDLVLLDSPERIQQSINDVNQQEQRVYLQLDIVKDRILGEEGKRFEREGRELFDQWRPIREEVMSLVREDQIRKAADITIGKGASHVAILEGKMLGLTNYARNKATNFSEDAERARSRVWATTIIFLISSVLLSLLTAFFTLRKTASIEMEIMEAKQLLENAIDFASIGMVMVAPGGNFTKVNQAFCNMMGYSENELLQMTFQDITHSDDYEISSDIVQRLMSGSIDRARIEKRYLKKDGTIINAFLTTFMLRDENGEPLFFFTQVIDITERYQAEERLRNSEQLLNEMGSIARIGGWTHDLVGGKATWTKELYKIIEFESDPVPGPKEHFSYYPPEERAILEKAFRHAIETGEQFDLELRCNTGKGRLIWARVIGRAEFKDGECVEMRGTFQDITERKKVEERLHQAYKMESIGNLAGGIAHDFNNILTSIIGFAELASDEAGDNKVLKDDLNEIFIAGRRAKDLTNEILAFSRQDTLETSLININTLISDSIRMLRATIPVSVEIQSELCEEILTIEANGSQMSQIIMNLVKNAADAIWDESGLVKIGTESLRLDQEDVSNYVSLLPGDYARVFISDTGCGIPKENYKKVFDPYFTTKETGRGTGLGLAVVHGIIKKHHGDITVYSEVGKGTTFNVYIPLSGKCLADAPVGDLLLPTGGHETVMLVDDEIAIVKMLKQVLEKGGYSVRAYTSSVDALADYESAPDSFDLVITDMTMPEMAGDKLAKSIKSIRPNIPLILCTGFSEKVINHGTDMIIDGFLMKPVERKKLLESVRRVLDEKNDIS